MRFIKNFEDTLPVLDRGITVVLRNPDKYFSQGHLIINNSKERKYNKENSYYEIWVGTNDRMYTRKRAPHKTSLLEEQQTTIVHELIHAINRSRGLETILGSFKSQSTGNILYHNRSYEIRIDIEAYRLIRDKNFLEKLVCELSTRPNCYFIYEIDDTPFIEFHTQTIRKLLPDFIPIS